MRKLKTVRITFDDRNETSEKKERKKTNKGTR